jgi:hypothetical protein
MTDAKRRKLDVVVCWKLDRFGRSLAHLITAIQTLTDAGVGFTSIGEGIDTRSATGRLMLGILGSFAEFERERIRERIHAGLARARRQGQRLGRRRERITHLTWSEFRDYRCVKPPRCSGCRPLASIGHAPCFEIPPAARRDLRLIRWVRTLRHSVSESLVSQTARVFRPACRPFSASVRAPGVITRRGRGLAPLLATCSSTQH